MNQGPYEGDAADPTTYFSNKSDLYARHRPGYPRQVFDIMLESLPQPPVAADIGCGTGISTRLLAQAGARVIGLDPSESMWRRAASDSPPEIAYREGTGEETGLPDASCHLVLCAQSFHWLDAPRVLREFHRILVPGGRLALMWNRRDPDDGPSMAYDRIMTEAERHAEQSGRVVRRARAADATIGGSFEHARLHVFPNPVRIDREGLLGRAWSASYYPSSGPLRVEFDRRLVELFDFFSRQGIVTLGQRCELTIAQRASRIR